MNEKKNIEKEIIDSLYFLYRVYPDFSKLMELYIIIEEEKAVKSIKRGVETLKAAISSSAGIAISSLLDLNLNIYSFASILGVTVLGGEVLYQMNKDESVYRIDKQNKKRLLKLFKKGKKQFQQALNYYLQTIEAYMPYLDKKEELNWLSEINNIMQDNETYIKENIENGIYESNFNKDIVLDIHNQVFEDTEEFNSFIIELKDSVDEEIRKSKIK